MPGTSILYVMNEPSGLLNTTCQAVGHDANRPFSYRFTSPQCTNVYREAEYASAVGYMLS